MAKVGDAYVEVRPDLDHFAARLKAALTGVDGKKEGERVTASFATGMKAGIASATGKFALLGGVAAAFAGPVAASLSGATAGTVALTSAVGASAGTMAVMPGLLGAFGQGLATVKLGSVGLKDAFKAQSKAQAELAATGKVSKDTLAAQKAAMAGLAPSARRFVTAIGDLGPKWLKVRQSVQGNLFAGTAREVKALASAYLPVLQKRLSGTATILNQTGHSFAAWAKQSSTVADVSKASGGLNRVLRTLSQAVVPLTKGLLDLFIPTLPWVNRLAKSVVNLALRFSQWALAARNGGGVTRFMQGAWSSAKLLLGILKNLTIAFKNIFVAGNSSGKSLLTTIRDLTRKFADWTGSMKGQNALKKWFKDGEGVTRELGGLLGDIGKMFGRLAKGSDGKAFVASLRLFVPPLEKLLTAMSSGGAGTGLTTALAGLADSLGTLVAAIPSTGALTAFVNTLSAILKPVAGLVTSTPGAAKGIAAIGAAFGTWKAISFVTSGIIGGVGGVVSAGKSIVNTGKGIYDTGKLMKEGFTDARVGMSAFAGPAQKIGGYARTVTTNLGAMASVGKASLTNLATSIKSGATAAAGAARSQVALAGAYARSALAAARQVASMVVAKTVMLAQSAATKAVAAAQWLLNAAMSANPIGLIIAAIAGLVVGLVILYKKSSVARAIMQAAFAGLVAAGRALMAGLGAALRGAANVVRAVVAVVRAYVKAWIAVFRTAARVIATVVRAGFAVVRTVISTVVKVIRALISGNFKAIPGIVSGAVGKLKGIVSGAFNRVVSIIKTAAGRVLTGAKNLAKNAANGLKDMVKSAPGIAGDMIRGLAHAIENGASAVVTAMGHMAGKAISAVKKKFKIFSPSRVMHEVGTNVSRGMANGINAGRKHVVSAAEKMAHAVIVVSTRGLVRLLTGSSKQVSAAWSKMNSIASQRFTGATEARVKRSLTTLKANWSVLLDRRTALTKKITAAQKAVTEALKAKSDYIKQITQQAIDFASITGFGGDVASASGQSFVSDMQARANAVSDFAANIVALQKLGLNATTLNQIVSAGVEGGSAAAAALVTGGSSVITQANSIQDQIAQSAKTLASTAAGQLYDAGIAAAQGLVKGLKSQMATLNAQMVAMAASMVRSIKKMLHIKSPSRVFRQIGAYTGQGFTLGIRGEQADAHRAIAGLISTPSRIGSPSGAFGSLPDAAQHTSTVRVFIGDTELTDIVRTEVVKGNDATARQITRGRKVVRT